MMGHLNGAMCTLLGWLILGLPVAPVAVAMGALQALAAQKRLPVPLLLPGLTGAAALYCAHQIEMAGTYMRGYLAATRLVELFWSIPLAWSALALVSVLVGWAVGACLRGKGGVRHA